MEEEIKDIQFAERLVRLRLNLPLRNAKVVTIKEVAEEAGINVGSLSRAENGIAPGEKILHRLADYYGVSMTYLVSNDKDYGQQDRPPPQAQDRDGLFGRTKQVDIDGQRFAVTTHEPAAKSQFLEPLAMLSEILASGDPILVQAIKANLRAFQTAILNRRQATDNAQQLNDLQQECADLKQRNEDQEKRLAALEKRLDEAALGKDCTQDRRDDTDEDQVDPGRRAAA